ncbi:actin, cytoplasmic 2 [Streptomyces sp. NPDC004311]|uniref:actin, cytoplasmic 2 n=1 Tax=Streptomyces sp. NPDC004311 TaxID=3364698 RepID=UPI0036998825
MSDNTNELVIVDLGAGSVKAGEVSSDGPIRVFPSLVGRPKNSGVMVGMAGQDFYVGDEAQAKRGILDLSRPFDQHRVADWDAVEKLLTYTFTDELRADPAESVVLMPVADDMSVEDRARLAGVLFDSVGVKGCALMSQGPLALRASNLNTGAVLDLGGSRSTVASVVNGAVLPETRMSLAVGGGDLTVFLSKLLLQSGIDLQRTSAELEIVRDIKEKLCYVSEDYDKEMVATRSDPNIVKTYELPDGNTIDIRSARTTCPEALFHPSLVGVEAGGVHSLVGDSIDKAPAESRQELYGAVVVVGGTSRTSGLAERLADELSRLAPSGVDPKIIAVPGRQYGAWYGGSAFAAADPTLAGRIISGDEYRAGGVAWHSKLAW